MSSVRKRARTTAPAPAAAPVRPTGPERFTVERFLSDCSEETRQFLLEQWGEGNQLVASRVPVDALPAVVILSAYAQDYGVNLTDDHIALLMRFDEHVTECWHPDKYLASCISILAERSMSPSDEAFEDINIPTIYEELFP